MCLHDLTGPYATSAKYFLYAVYISLVFWKIKLLKEGASSPVEVGGLQVFISLASISKSLNWLSPCTRLRCIMVSPWFQKLWSDWFVPLGLSGAGVSCTPWPKRWGFGLSYPTRWCLGRLWRSGIPWGHWGKLTLGNCASVPFFCLKTTCDSNYILYFHGYCYCYCYCY